MWEKIKEKWAVISVALLAIAYFIIDRQGRKLVQVKQDLEREKLNAKLQKTLTEADQALGDFSSKLDVYERLKAKYGADANSRKPGDGTS